MRYFILIILLLSSPLYAGVDFDEPSGDDKFDCGALNMANWTGFTMSAWINPTSSASDEHTVFSNWVSSSFAGILFRLEPSVDDMECFTVIGANSQIGGQFTSSVIPNTWNHIACRYNKTALEVFVNGTKSATSFAGTSDLDGSNSTNDLDIGTTPHAGTDDFDGQITEIAIWDVALTDSELIILANSNIKHMPFQIQPGNLQRYYPMDDLANGLVASGRIIKDLSGNGDTCTGVGGASMIAKAEEILSYP